MARHQTHRWIDFLAPLIENLNTSKHESTGFTPLFLMEQPELESVIDRIHERMERKRPKHPESLHQVFALGDFVRTALVTESAIRKQTFRKKIMANYSSDIFQIYSISKPAAASTQQQYLLYNTTTKRRSKKRYWGYQLQKISDETVAAAIEKNNSDEEENANNDSNDEDEEVLEPAPIRRSSRAWAPSAQALNNIARR